MIILDQQTLYKLVLATHHCLLKPGLAIVLLANDILTLHTTIK